MATSGRGVIRRRLESVAQDLVPKINGHIQDLASNEKVQKFDLKVDKKTGVVRLSAKNVDGRTVTKTLIGPGLEATMQYNPNGNSRDDRDYNILRLLDAGMTQTEVATRLGVSQALVSKVHRSRGA